jgi:hypothetical protein
MAAFGLLSALSYKPQTSKYKRKNSFLSTPQPP